MPYTPKTWATGNVIIAADLNNLETQYTTALADLRGAANAWTGTNSYGSSSSPSAQPAIAIYGNAANQASIQLYSGAVQHWNVYGANNSTSLIFYSGPGAVNAMTLTQAGALSLLSSITATTAALTGSNLAITSSQSNAVEIGLNNTDGRSWALVNWGSAAGGGTLQGILSIYDNTAGAHRLKIGTAGDFDFIGGNLTTTGVVNAAHDTCRAYKTTSVQSVNDSTLTAVTLNAETFDTNTMHDNSTNNSRITIKKAGLYQVFGQVAYAANATGTRQAHLYKNAATELAVTIHPLGSATHITMVRAEALVSLAVNDYLEVYAQQTSTGALNVETGSSATYLEAILVRQAP